jgi:type IV secretion system protein VirD4
LLGLIDRSIIVTDPKGELAAVTSRHRATVGDCLILNPFDVLGLGSAGFNPLASLDSDSEMFKDDAEGLGEALIQTEDKDPHWSDSARNLIVALVMWEVTLAKEQSREPLLENVRFMLTEPEEKDDNGKPVRGFRARMALMCASGSREIASLASRFLKETDEVASVLATAERQTSWILSTPMRRDLGINGVDFTALKRKPTTIYVVLPAERMRTHSVWLRLVIVTALRSLFSPGGVRTIFMMDEFAQLGRLGPIEDALGLVRGYGVQLWPVLQDLNQLKALYQERWESFLGNAGVVIGYGPNDLTTAEWMSKRAGESTVVAKGYNHGDSTNKGGGGSSEGFSFQQAQRRLLLPHELMDLPKGCGLVWPAGTSMTIPFFAHVYDVMPEYEIRSDDNPYYR